MNEFRTALQALVDIISKCNTCSIMVIHGHPTEFDTARALLARPEPEGRCKHGVRMPHECKECVYETPMEEVRAWQKQQSAEAEQVARPEPAPTYTVNPAPDAAAPMSPGKTFTAVATYKGMPFSRPEPAPRITREEAEKLLDAYEYSTTEDKACKAREACLAAMLRNDL